jgi:RNA polymerase sigma-70 factor, ECF subfamily
LKTNAKVSDEDLFRSSLKGDRIAFECLYERYFSKLTWYASQYVKEQDLAKDIVQDIFMKLIEKPEMFNPSLKFSTWIYTVAGNRCRNHLRDSKRRVDRETRSNEDSYSASAESGFDKKLLNKRISEELERLSDRERLVYTLRFEEELNIREIAGVTSIPEGTIKSVLHYMLRKIAQRLKEFNHAE